MTEAFPFGYPHMVGEAQLGSMLAVFASWKPERAQAYREIEGIDHDLGTAVTAVTVETSS